VPSDAVLAFKPAPPTWSRSGRTVDFHQVVGGLVGGGDFGLQP
jgi:hypothetical protein